MLDEEGALFAQGGADAVGDLVVAGWVVRGGREDGERRGFGAFGDAL